MRSLWSLVTMVIHEVGASDDPQPDVRRAVHRLWVLANITFAESTFTLRRC